MTGPNLAAEAVLRRAYSQVPDVGCKGLCVQSCGPIQMHRYEADRLLRAAARAGVEVEAVEQDDGYVGLRTGSDMTCPALVDGRCSVYEARPAICRVWGATRDMACPFGCEPPRWLTFEESTWIIHGAPAEADRAAGL